MRSFNSKLDETAKKRVRTSYVGALTATAHYVAADTGQMLEIFLVLGMHAWRTNANVSV